MTGLAFLFNSSTPYIIAMATLAGATAGLVIWGRPLRLGKQALWGYEAAGLLLLIAITYDFTHQRDMVMPLLVYLVCAAGYLGVAVFVAALGRLLKVPRLVVMLLATIAELSATGSLVYVGMWLAVG